MPNFQSMTKPRCFSYSGCVLSIAACIVFGFAKIEHATYIAALETISSYIYHEAQLKPGIQSPDSQAALFVQTASIPPQRVPPGSDIQTPPLIQSYSGTQPDEELAKDVPHGAVNYLEPFDPSLRPGDCRLDGLLLSASDNEIKMRVLWVTLPGERRTVFAAPRNKTIVFFPSTQIMVNHQQATAPVPSDVSENPVHVAAIGPVTQPGAPMSARSIDMESTSRLETDLGDFMQNAAIAMMDQQRTSPDITLQHAEIAVGGRSESVEYIRAKAGTYRIAVGLAGGKVGATESLGAIAKRYDAIAAINGSFFDCYAPGLVKMPDHALISGGRLVARGGVGTMIGETPDGEIRFERNYDTSRWHEYDPSNPNPEIQQDPESSVIFWARVSEGLGCGPRLVTNGAVSLAPSQEGFSSAEVLKGVSVRSAVGITEKGDLVLVVTHASLPQLAQDMVELGCRDAMNLDGGASSGLWLRGQSLRTPGRLLSNALVVEAR